MSRLRKAALGAAPRALGVLVLLAFALLAPCVSAAANCPWVTPGSAVNWLGGPVSAVVRVSESGEGSCTFTRQAGAKSILKIVVSKAALESCPAHSAKPQGIGNEAALCKLQPSPNEAVELLVSRVREFHFTVSLSMPRDESPGGITHAEDAVKQIAEQVAGNLF